MITVVTLFAKSAEAVGCNTNLLCRCQWRRVIKPVKVCWKRRYKEQVAYERVVLHAFQLPHVVSTFRVLVDFEPTRSFIAEKVVRRGRLKTVAGTPTQRMILFLSASLYFSKRGAS